MIEQYTLDIVDWIRVQPALGIYVVFLLIAYTENVLPPIPGDILVVFGGYIAAEQIVSFSGILTLTTIGSVLGFMTMYYLGYKLGDELRHRRSRFWFLRFFDNKYMDKVESWMQRWGQGVILANRFLAGTRSIISIIAGISRTPAYRTMLSATISALLWNFILIWIGWIIQENWPSIQYYLNVYGSVIVGLIIVFIGYKLIRYWLKKKKKREHQNEVEN